MKHNKEKIEFLKFIKKSELKSQNLGEKKIWKLDTVLLLLNLCYQSFVNFFDRLKQYDIICGSETIPFNSWFELPWGKLASYNLWNLIALFFFRVLWRSFPWNMEWHRCCDQGFPRARFNCWKHGRFLQWDNHSQVFRADLLFVSNFVLHPTFADSQSLCPFFVSFCFPPADSDILMVLSNILTNSYGFSVTI